MKTVIVASTNPVKVQTIREAFEVVFPEESFEVEGRSVTSGVSDQPRSDEEAVSGARNRVQAVIRQDPRADFWVGIEAGIEERGGAIYSFGWVVVRSSTTEGSAKTGMFLLPPPVVTLLRTGMELGQADDVVFGTSNSKQAMGAVGLLTGNLITRLDLYRPAAILALLPFTNALYQEPACSRVAGRVLSSERGTPYDPLP
jgi:inosine/xanthosine triphosphatase